MKFFLLINVKMPTTVGILTVISRNKRILCLSEPENTEFLDIFILMSILKFSCSTELSMKKSFITSGPGVSLAWIIQKVNINTYCHKSYHHSILTVADWICLHLNKHGEVLILLLD